MRGYHLSLYRHGRTRANEEGIYIGSTDYSLTDMGCAELAGKTDQYELFAASRYFSLN